MTPADGTRNEIAVVVVLSVAVVVVVVVVVVISVVVVVVISVVVVVVVVSGCGTGGAYDCVDVVVVDDVVVGGIGGTTMAQLHLSAQSLYTKIMFQNVWLIDKSNL